MHNDNNGVFVPIIRITIKYTNNIKPLIKYLFFPSIKINIIGVNKDIIPLISFAEL